MMKTMGITAAEIEGDDALAAGLPSEARRQQAQAQLEAIAKQASELRAHPVFTQAGETMSHPWDQRFVHVPLEIIVAYPFYLSTLRTDTGGPLHLYIAAGVGCGLYASNDAFNQFFQGLLSHDLLL